MSNDFFEFSGFNGFDTDENLNVEGRMNYLMPLFLLIDTSGSMSGQKIEQVKSAVEQIKLELGSMNSTNDDAEIRVSVLCFDTSTRWEAQFQDPNLLNADFQVGGLTSMGAAFVELEKMLTRSRFSQVGQFAGYKRAVMILLTDGIPTDEVDTGIAKLRKNNWFVKGTRIAFAIGGDADISCLEKFTGHNETVLQVDNISILGHILSTVATVSSSTATHAAGLSLDDAVTQAEKDAEFELSAKESAISVINAGEQMIVNGELNERDAENIFGDFSSW